MLKSAFGSDEAVAMIKLLNADIGGLEKNIATLGNIKGMDKAVEMAQAMADPWEQAAAIINGIRIEIGTQLLPVLYPFIQKSNEGGKSFVAGYVCIPISHGLLVYCLPPCWALPQWVPLSTLWWVWRSLSGQDCGWSGWQLLRR